MVVLRAGLGQHGGRHGRISQELQGRTHSHAVGVLFLLDLRGCRVQSRCKLRDDAGELVLAAVLGSHHGLDHIEDLLVEPHRHQHGQRLVVVELVALRDGLDPASHPPRVEIKPAAGDPVTVVGQPAGHKQIT